MNKPDNCAGPHLRTDSSISSEDYRIYTYADGSEFRIGATVAFQLSQAGECRPEDGRKFLNDARMEKGQDQ